MKRLFPLVTAAIIVVWCQQGCKKSDATPDHSCAKGPTVSAGDDIVATGKTSITLKGTTSEKSGTWEIVEGEGGKIETGTSTTFTGLLKNTYKLKFTSKNDCGESSDELKITLNPDCGDNLTVTQMADNMHWIAQSCFRINAGPFKIYTDPLSIKEKDTADIIVITHGHGDHFSPDDLDKIVGPNTILIAPADINYTGQVGQRIVLVPGQEFNAFNCVNIKAVPAYNINKTQYHPKSNNWVGYLITVNGITVYHAGDTERIPEMKTFACDIALLPLGQTYTFDSVDDAVEAAKDVHAKLAIPMHFGLYEGTADDAVTFKNKLNATIPVIIKEKED